MYCIGCGEPLRVTAGKCPACGTAVVGARFVETIPLETTEALVEFDSRYAAAAPTR